MATKKAAAKKATGAKNPGTAMAKWDEELAKRASQAAATAKSVSSGHKTISTKSGTFGIDGANVGQELDCVILGFTLENAYYTDNYDPDNMSIPVCFAFGEDSKTMAPIPEDVQELQSDACKGCPMNDFGTADTGRGKACKNQAKLLLIADTDLEDIESAEARVLKVPVTSVKNLMGYIKNLEDKFRRPPLAMITKITLKPDPKTQFSMNFGLEAEIEDGELIGQLIELSDSLAGDLTKPYEPMSDEEKAERAASKNRGKGKKGGRVVESAPARGVAARRKAAAEPETKPAPRRPGRGR